MIWFITRQQGQKLPGLWWKNLNIGWATLCSNRVFAQTNNECLTLLWRNFGPLVSSFRIVLIQLHWRIYILFKVMPQHLSWIQVQTLTSCVSGHFGSSGLWGTIWQPDIRLQDFSRFPDSISVGKADQTHSQHQDVSFYQRLCSLTPNTETWTFQKVPFLSHQSTLGAHRDVSGQCETILHVLFGLQRFSPWTLLWPLSYAWIMNSELTEACSSLMLFWGLLWPPVWLTDTLLSVVSWPLLGRLITGPGFLPSWIMAHAVVLPTWHIVVNQS